MVKFELNYQGGLRVQAVHLPSGATLNTDAPVDNHGRGESFSPTDLCAVALGSCLATILGIKAQNMGIDLGQFRMEASKEMTTEPPRRIARLVVHLHLPAGIAKRDQESLERSARACPVHQSLHPEIEQEIHFHWGE